MTKAEIEIELQKKGDYVKIDYLTRLLEEKQLPIDRKKFVWLKLAEIYEQKGMLIEAGKMYNNIAVNSIILNDKTITHESNISLSNIKAYTFLHYWYFHFIDNMRGLLFWLLDRSLFKIKKYF